MTQPKQDSWIERFDKQFYGIDYQELPIYKLLSDELKDFIRQERERAKEQIEFDILQQFMGFIRNGHNLKPGDLDRIENEYALFMSRNYTTLYVDSLTQETSGKEKE